MICKNCGHKATDKYCAYCGQPAAIERLNVKELLLNFWDVFTHRTWYISCGEAIIY
ncbi:MAG TPA: hypothetical protein VGK25_09730 [Ignavibacteria bacterium]